MALFAVWLFVPAAVLLVHTSGCLGVGSRGRHFTGIDDLDVVDQLQYLAWIRDGGGHVPFSDQFDPRPDAHLFLHPVFVISSLAWRLGLSLQVAFPGLEADLGDRPARRILARHPAPGGGSVGARGGPRARALMFTQRHP